MKRLALVAMIALVACAAAPVTLPPTVRVAPGMFPDSVLSAVGQVAVIWDDSLRDGAQGLLGGFRPDTRAIYIHSALKVNLRAALLVLVHERCHVVVWDAGLRNFYNTPEAEQLLDAMCDAFATARLAGWF